ncbi:hypothetical protein J1614_002301 [Plenodomus biglobosus]|nr:hypothetical protein J1614_002301 [Plenodomus biglobosus]
MAGEGQKARVGLHRRLFLEVVSSTIHVNYIDMSGVPTARNTIREGQIGTLEGHVQSSIGGVT